MVLGNRLERFRRKAQVHGVTRLVLKIDREARKNSVHRSDAAEAPTAMHAVAAGRQLHQRLDMAALDLSGRHHFLKFLSHNTP
jgi:hypothetical protein